MSFTVRCTPMKEAGERIDSLGVTPPTLPGHQPCGIEVPPWRRLPRGAGVRSAVAQSCKPHATALARPRPRSDLGQASVQEIVVGRQVEQAVAGVVEQDDLLLTRS